MTTHIFSKDEYYFKGGAFHLKSKWTKRVQMFIAALFVLSLFVPSMNADANFVEVEKRYLQLKSKFAFKESAMMAYVKSINKKLTNDEISNIIQSITKHSKDFNFEPELILALAKVESTFDKHSISPVGAVGLLQVLPQYHVTKIIKARNELGNPELFDISTNVWLGSFVLREYVNEQKDLVKALQKYNGSLGNSKFSTDVLNTKNEIEKFIRKNVG